MAQNKRTLLLLRIVFSHIHKFYHEQVNQIKFCVFKFDYM